MVTILLIADQDRLERLFDFTRESSQIGFRVSRSLRQGILDIAEAPPAVLFIQNHLSGLSGEIIARHLVAEIAERRPTVALFGEGNRCSPVPGCVDACLDVSLPDEELTAAIISLIAESTDALVESAVPSETAFIAKATTASPSFAEECAEEPALPTATGETPLAPGSRVEGPSAAEANSRDETSSSFDLTLQTALDDAPAPVSLAELEDTVTLRAPAAHDGNSAETGNGVLRSRGRAPSQRFRPYLAAGGILIAGTLLFLFISPEITPTPPSKAAPAGQQAETVAKPTASPDSALPRSAPTAKTETPPTPPSVTATDGNALPVQPAVSPSTVQPSGTPPVPVQTAKGLAKLPAFIPRDGLDKGYGTAHPGWERYRGARTEFKVYRQNQTIMAIQAIDRSGVGIPESFMRGALAQVTGGRDYAVQTREAQGKFHVEKGSAASGSRVVIYRSAPKGSIRAFVVHFN